MSPAKRAPDSTVPDQIRKALHLALAEKGMTQRQLAQRVNMSEVHVSQILTGRSEVGSALLDRLAAALGAQWTVRLDPLAPESDAVDDPLAIMATQLRVLLANSPYRSVRQLAQHVANASHDTINAAVRGHRVVSWQTVRSVVHVLNGDVPEFHRLWLATTAQRSASKREDAMGNIDKAIGGQLRTARRALGLSRLEVAQHLGFPMNTYSCYEQGIRPCSTERLAPICHFLELDIGEVVGRAVAATQATGLAPMPSHAPSWNELQSIATAWHRRRFPDATALHVALQAASELGEVFNIMNGQAGDGDVVSEVADTMIALMVLVGRWYHGDVMTATAAKLRILCDPTSAPVDVSHDV